jgi:hypothetical protein
MAVTCPATNPAPAAGRGGDVSAPCVPTVVVVVVVDGVVGDVVEDAGVFAVDVVVRAPSVEWGAPGLLVVALGAAAGELVHAASDRATAAPRVATAIGRRPEWRPDRRWWGRLIAEVRPPSVGEVESERWVMVEQRYGIPVRRFPCRRQILACRGRRDGDV